MKLLDYLGHVVRIKTHSGLTYIGYVIEHKPYETPDGKEEIVVETPILEISEDQIADICDFRTNQPKQQVLLSIEEISDHLDISNKMVREELDKIRHTEYNIGNNITLYDLETAFNVAANLGKMNMFEWYCDQCDDHLNDQEGFENNNGTWECTRCGHENIISKENIK